jgi:hypothetical protein
MHNIKKETRRVEQDLEISACQISRRLNLRLLNSCWHVVKLWSDM